MEDYFAPRQALALGTMAALIRNAGHELEEVEASDFSVAVQTCLALSFGRILDLANSLCGWTWTLNALRISSGDKHSNGLEFRGGSVHR